MRSFANDLRAGRDFARSQEKLLACITTKTDNVTGDDARPDDLYNVWTIVNIKRMMRNEGIMRLSGRASSGSRSIEWTADNRILKRRCGPTRASPRDDEEVEALKATFRE